MKEAGCPGQIRPAELRICTPTPCLVLYPAAQTKLHMTAHMPDGTQPNTHAVKQSAAQLAGMSQDQAVGGRGAGKLPIGSRCMMPGHCQPGANPSSNIAGTVLHNQVASIMLTLTLDGWCALPVFPPPVSRALIKPEPTTQFVNHTRCHIRCVQSTSPHENG
jgi:hypothetical protein